MLFGREQQIKLSKHFILKMDAFRWFKNCIRIRQKSGEKKQSADKRVSSCLTDE